MEFKTNSRGYVTDSFYVYLPTLKNELLLVKVDEFSDFIFVTCSLGGVQCAFRYDKPKYDVEEAILDSCEKIY